MMSESQTDGFERRRGLVCRRCGCTHFEVTHTIRKPNGTIRRRRVCRHCGRAIMTEERSR